MRGKRRAWNTVRGTAAFDAATRGINPTLVLGNEDDEVLATIFRGLLSKRGGWSLQKVILPESGRVGWKLYISAAVTMDTEAADTIVKFAETTI